MSMHPNAPFPQAAPGPVGSIVLNVQGNRAFANMVPPSVTVDGLLFPTNYGRNHFQVPAGRRHVFIWSQWLRRYGQATIEVDVPPGGTVELFYAAPVHQFSTGSVGFQKQLVKGMPVMWATVGLVVVVGITLLVLTVQ